MGRGFAFIAAVILLVWGLPHTFQVQPSSWARQTQAPAVKRSSSAIALTQDGVIASPDGQFLYVAEQGANRVRIIDTAAGETIRLISTGERPSGLRGIC